ncbi:hypothetical protein M9H77_03967 [Catharanthus roseus]|uniref:Uncharacterized protein n=1 Tax=Catharanthus roseus TaxID=4058 RepID=A0ACC0CD68_CATRO|nr:hypothetical protein M9H77_03967 [Catharanthus roseus]
MATVPLLHCSQVSSLNITRAPPLKLQGLESCSTVAELKQHHAQTIKLGLSSDNHAMGRVIKLCALSEIKNLNYALRVFHTLPSPDAFIYNTMIRGYLESNCPQDYCIAFYIQMLRNSVSPNNFTFPPLIRACCIDGAIQEGKQVHSHIIKFGFSSDGFLQNNLIHMYVNFNSLKEAKKVFCNLAIKDDVSWTTLISGYAQWGCIDEAHQFFQSMPYERRKNSAVSWNAMIAAYVQSNRFHEALDLFEKMRAEKVKIDKFVAASVLSACTGLGALEQGKWIHKYIEESGIEIDSKLGTTIIDMYCKCGCLDMAFQVFNRLTSKGISSWNSMIGGLAVNGKGMAAIELLKEMERQNKVSPDYITFVNVLSGCAHSGLVEEGRYYFRYMTEVYGIEPGMEHYGCMVDLLGRAGLLKEARKVIDEMPMNPDASVLGALLGACKIHGNFELGKEIGRQVIELEPNNSGRYVLLANLYANSRGWEEVANVRKLMNDRGVKKAPGSSVIELDGIVNEFTAGGRTHPQAKEIYANVNEMLDCIRSAGYVPIKDGALHDISEEEKENPLYYHSEKLAMALGLLRTKPGETLRITKNLRVCKDCHQVGKLISKVYDREIVVRDRNRFHHFKGGECSCNDYW